MRGGEMLELFLRLFIALVIMYLMYLKGFTDCMFDKNTNLYDKIKEYNINKCEEDNYSDD